MRLPTIVSESPLRSGSTGPQSSAADFGGLEAAAMGNVAEGIGSFNRPLSQMAEVNARKKRVDDGEWVATSLAQEQKYLMEWMSNPENNAKESFAQDFDELVKERSKKYPPFAPSPEAARLFDLNFKQDTLSMYNAALNTSAKTRVSNISTGIDQQTSQLADSYRAAVTVPGMDANGVLINGLERLEKYTDETIGQLSPTLARKHKDDATVSMVYASMDQNPDLAKEILARNKNIDEHTRRVLTKQIEQSVSAIDSSSLALLEQQIADWETGIEYGTIRDNFDHKLIQSILPRDKAQDLITKVDAHFNRWNKAREMQSGMSSYNAHTQRQMVEDFAKTVKTQDDGRVHQYLLKAVQRNLDLQEKNPVSYLSTNNPVVRGALERSMNSKDFTEYYAMLTKYQGAPPYLAPLAKDATPTQKEAYRLEKQKHDEDAKHYLYRPTGQQHIVDLETATSIASSINNGTISDVQSLTGPNGPLSKVPARYFAQAFNDLVTLPPGGQGISPSWQLAFANPKNEKYMSVLKNPQAIANLSPESRSKFEEAFKQNAEWLGYARGDVIDERFQQAGSLAAFQEGITLYAMALSQNKGLAPEKAVAQATKELLSFMSNGKVNGRNLWISNNREGQAPRTPEDAAAITGNLQLSLQMLQPQAISPTTPDGYTIFGEAESIQDPFKKNSAIYNAIQMNGYFKTAPDGQGATLYYSNGFENFELRDHHGRAFYIDFDEVQKAGLSSYRTVTETTLGGGGVTGTREKKEYLYPELQQKPGFAKFPYRKADFIRRLDRNPNPSDLKPTSSKLKKEPTMPK